MFSSFGWRVQTRLLKRFLAGWARNFGSRASHLDEFSQEKQSKGSQERHWTNDSRCSHFGHSPRLLKPRGRGLDELARREKAFTHTRVSRGQHSLLL